MVQDHAKSIFAHCFITSTIFFHTLDNRRFLILHKNVILPGILSSTISSGLGDRLHSRFGDDFLEAFLDEFLDAHLESFLGDGGLEER